jgi:hypothetical protein
LSQLLGLKLFVGAGLAAAAQASKPLFLQAHFPAVGRGVGDPEFGGDLIDALARSKQGGGIHALLLQALPSTQLSLDYHPSEYHISSDLLSLNKGCVRCLGFSPRGPRFSHTLLLRFNK